MTSTLFEVRKQRMRNFRQIVDKNKKYKLKLFRINEFIDLR